MTRLRWFVALGLIVAVVGAMLESSARTTLADPLATSQAARTRIAEGRGTDEQTPTPATGNGEREADAPERPDGVPPSATEAEVAGHIDGDKLRVRINGNEQEVLLLGVDAPEADEGPMGECYAEEASEQLEELVPRGTTVYLEQDGDDKDGKDRLLRFLWFDDDGEAVNANARLLREGAGSLDDRGEDTRYKAGLTEAQSDAKADDAGLWGECGENHVELVAPTPTPALGEGELPAPIGTTLTGGGVAVTLTNAFYADEYGYATPKGGYVFLVLEVAIENTDDEGHGYAGNRFSAKDFDTGAEFDDTITLAVGGLGTGDLSPGEYVSGVVVLEVQERTSRVRIKYATAAFGGTSLYWLVG